MCGPFGDRQLDLIDLLCSAKHKKKNAANMIHLKEAAKILNGTLFSLSDPIGSFVSMNLFLMSSQICKFHHCHIFIVIVISEIVILAFSRKINQSILAF